MATPSILIVDDEIIIARELEARLSGMGYVVPAIAPTGEEAIRLAVDLQPDLVLMDINLKGDMDGIDAAAEIRRRCAVPVIYVTAYTDQKTLERAKVTEPFAYLVKPFAERELNANIEMALYKHRVESRLRRLERWFGAALDTIADAVIATDLEGRITMFNQAAEAITDWPRALAIGRPLHEVYRLVDRRGDPVDLAEAAAGPLVCLGDETQLLDRANQAIPIDSTTSYVRDASDQPAGSVSIFRDPSGRRHGALVALNADVALAASQALTPRGMLQLCAESMVRNLNAAFARVWTVDADEDVLELQASAGMYTHLDGPHGRVPIGQLKIGLIAEERKPHLTNDVLTDPRVSDPDWARREGLVAFAGYPLVVEDRLVGVMAMFSRQTLAESTLEALRSVASSIAVAVERKQGEEALLAARQRLEQMLSFSPTMIYSLRVEGDDISLDWVSDNVTACFGYAVDEALEDGWWFRHLYADDRDRVLSETNRMLSTVDQREVEYRFEHKDGRTLWVRDQARAVRDADGRLRRIVGGWMDVTSRRATEDQLLQAQKMESIGRLAGGVAHDFNNLLTVITGTVDLLLADVEAAGPREDLLEIRRSADRATALTRQLLALSRRQIFEPRVLNLNAVLAGMESMLRRVIGEDIDLAVATDATLGNVRADPAQLEQVVMNLVVNSRDAMPSGGKLTIETANVSLDDAYARAHVQVTPGPYVMLAVSDTGTGMDDAVRQRVFEPFYTTKPPGRGTGLGLSTVYGIVKQSEGHVWLYSEPGVGTTFKVYLPLVEETASDEAKAVSTTANGTETILLVEDDPSLCQLVRRALESLGYTVLAAGTPAEALATAEHHEGDIHLLLTDVVMPVMQGPALAARLHRLRPDARVLYMSGYTETAILRQGSLDDGLHLISKPFDIAALGQRVRQVLDATE